MSKLSVEFSLGLVAALVLYLLDKSGKSNAALNVALLVLILGFLLHPALQIRWIWSPQDVAMRTWRIGLIVCVVLFSVSWFGIWTWPRQSLQGSSAEISEGKALAPPIPAPPEFTVFSPGFDGSEIAGIKWEERFLPPLIVIVISRNAPLIDLDFEVHLDRGVSEFYQVQIIAINQITNLLGVVSFPATGPLSVQQARIEVEDQKGEKHSYYSKPDAQHGASVWRVHCDKLIQDAELKLVICGIRMASIDSNTDSYKPDRSPAKRVEVNGTFKYGSGGELRTQKFQHSFEIKPLSSTPSKGASPP